MTDKYMALSEYLSSVTAVIFDLDNTILDSHLAWKMVDAEFFRRRNIAEAEEYGRKVATMTFKEAAEYSIALLGLDETVDEITSEWFELIRDQYAGKLKIFDGVRELLEYLKGRGCAIALATAATEELYTLALKSNNIYECFDAFASVEETKRGKGFSDVYELAAERLGVKPAECIVFEDILLGIRAAKSCGMKTAAFLNPFNVNEHRSLEADADFSFDSYIGIV